MRRFLILVGLVALVVACSSGDDGQGKSSSVATTRAPNTTRPPATNTVAPSAKLTVELGKYGPIEPPPELLESGFLNADNAPVAIDVVVSNGTNSPELVSYTLTTEQGQKYSGVEVPLMSGTEIAPGATRSSRVVFATLAQPIGVGKPVRIEASTADGTVVASRDV